MHSTTAIRTRSDTMLAAALAAVGRGWFVFPVRRDSKTPAVHGEDSCPRTGTCRAGHQGWEQRAMLDPDQVRWYWTSPRFTGCNIGIACGPSGLVVIDLDLPKPGPPSGCTRGHRPTGWDTLTRLCATAGQPVPGDTRTVATPSGGTHLYYQAPTGIALRNTRGEHGGLGALIDTRGRGGYILAPGSITPNGAYRLTYDRHPLDLPAWLVQALAPKPPPAITAAALVPTDRLGSYVTAALRSQAQRVIAAPPGAHTHILFTSAIALGQLVGADLLPAGTAEHTLRTAAAHMITGPCHCTEREITRTITNGLRRGIAQPRVLPTRHHNRREATR